MVHAARTALRTWPAETFGLDRAPLVLAALYHDADHTGRPGIDDQINIERAVSAWCDHGLPLEQRAHAKMGTKPPAWLEDVPRLIQATRWPHRPTDRLDEAIIRNADLAESTDPDWAARLEEETGQPAVPGFAGAHMANLTEIALAQALVQPLPCPSLAVHQAHQWGAHNDRSCPGLAHDHDSRCCPEHAFHTNPHRGCILR